MAAGQQVNSLTPTLGAALLLGRSLGADRKLDVVRGVGRSVYAPVDDMPEAGPAAAEGLRVVEHQAVIVGDRGGPAATAGAR